MSGGGSSAYMALHLKQNAVETPVCPDLARLESASVQSYINEEVVVSGNENAFEVISHGRTFATIASLKNLTLQDMLTNWFEFDISQSSDLFCKNATIRDKVRTVMKFVLERSTPGRLGTEECGG